ncbi:MAG: protein kinase [Planctomycetota bacterium]
MVCPSCASATLVVAGESLAACPRCGSRLRDAGEAPDDSGLAGLDAAETGLIAELREAFRGFPEHGRTSVTAWLAAGRLADESTTPGPAAAISPGDRLGDFELVAEIGRGGMGTVFRARQISLGREVALKVLPGGARWGAAVERFRTEAQAAARLHHTNIVAIHAQGECEGHFYYVMELVEGVDLDVVIREKRGLLSASGATEWTRGDYRRIAGLLADVADALDCAHRSGVIHRDVKPHNLLLGHDGRLHLTDFGLARLTDEPHLTRAGELMGTPAYMSPEQLRPTPAGIDSRTDIYALGATLYELMTGRQPFEGETREQIITGILTGTPPAVRRVNPRVPRDLETICLRALERAPGARHASAAELAEDLRRFATERPILSRRARLPERAAKWARRHKPATAAIALVVVALALGGGLTWKVQSEHADEARRLLNGAWEQLAYNDYRQPGLVEAQIAHAEQLGADPWQLVRVRALARLGANAPADALALIEPHAMAYPADVTTGYLLAWAQYRNRQVDESRATVAQLEQQGDPNTPEGWFFRGLCIHFERPAEALAAYREAVRLRAQANQFFPQAVLHLARARNQQLYRERTADGVAEADESLRQLIEHGYYKAFPHYLLSITHRLAAEIYSGSAGTRADVSARHYELAREYARRGQAVDPADDRPVTAEAECLESMGNLGGAIEARTRALALSAAGDPRDPRACETYHYRWRLYFWIGDLDAAATDLREHAACVPNSQFYKHVYPALLAAERGEMDTALALAREQAGAPGCPAIDVLWAATTLRLIGADGEARQLLEQRAADVDYAAALAPAQDEVWMRALYEMLRTGAEPATLAELANATAAPWKLAGEAAFHAAAARLAAGDRTRAEALFADAYRSFDGEEGYTYHAKLIWWKLRENPRWPAWGRAVSSLPEPVAAQTARAPATMG